MAYRGALEFVYRRFGGGLCTALDPTELNDDQAADARNVDMDAEFLRKRLGYANYGATGLSGSACYDLGIYYGAGGATPLPMVHGGASVFADANADGDFGDANETIRSLTSTTEPLSLGCQFRDTAYFGNLTNALHRWKGSGVSAAVTNIAAPGSAPTLSPLVVRVEDFETAAGWTAHTGGTLAAADEATIKLQGTNCLKITADASGDRGDSFYKAFSLGATVDLSEAEELVFWVQCDQPGIQFVVAIYEDGTTPAAGTQPNWSEFPPFTIDESNKWFRVRLPLGAVEPTARDASPGLGIRFLSDGGRGFSPAINLYFDDMQIQSGMEPDEYRYYTVYVEKDSNGNVLRRSAPSAAGTILLQPDSPFKGVNIGVTSFSAAAGTTGYIRVYRYRKNGPFRRAVMVKEVANSTATVTDTRDDRAVAEDPTAEAMAYYVSDPPLCATWAVVNNRLIGGYAKISSTEYPWRVYLSAFNYPEEFSTFERPPADTPTAAGWFDLPEKDRIRRIIDFDGRALILCDRSIWSLEGTGWDNFAVYKRAAVGVLSYHAVVATDRLIYFWAEDGVRVLAPTGGEEGLWDCWRISEPIMSLLPAFSASWYGCLGLDERGRVHVGYYGDEALVFDPRVAGALAPGENLRRPGWTRYTSWYWRCFARFRGTGRMLGGDSRSCAVHRIHIDSSGNPIYADAGTVFTFRWEGKSYDAGPGMKAEWVYIGHEADVLGSAINAVYTPILDRIASANTTTLPLNNASGQAEKNCAAAVRGRVNAVRVIPETSNLDVVIRSIRVGYWLRG